MSGKGRKQVSKTSVRFDDEDLRDLSRCQQILGSASQSHTLRLLMRMFLGKIPNMPPTERGKGKK